MGPFKHTVDDGLDIRKAAYECMYTLLDSCLDKVDIFEFINHVETGLKDHYDIKMLTYLMVARLSQICPGAVFQSKSVFFVFATCTLWPNSSGSFFRDFGPDHCDIKKTIMSDNKTQLIVFDLLLYFSVDIKSTLYSRNLHCVVNFVIIQ